MNKEKSPDAEDRRAHPRTPINMQVEYKRLNTFLADYTKNISKGGTFIKTQKPLSIGTDFIFNLRVPTLKDPIVLSGRVQWVVKPGEEKPGEQAGMGIQFSYSSDGERKTVDSTVERLMIDSLGKHLYEKLLGQEDSSEDNG